MKKRSLKTSLISRYLFAFILSSLVFLVFHITQQVESFKQNYFEQYKQLLSLYLPHLETALQTNDLALLSQEMRQLRGDLELYSIAVFNADGQLVRYQGSLLNPPDNYANYMGLISKEYVQSARLTANSSKANNKAAFLGYVVTTLSKKPIYSFLYETLIASFLFVFLIFLFNFILFSKYIIRIKNNFSKLISETKALYSDKNFVEKIDFFDFHEFEKIYRLVLKIKNNSILRITNKNQEIDEMKAEYNNDSEFLESRNIELHLLNKKIKEKQENYNIFINKIFLLIKNHSEKTLNKLDSIKKDIRLDEDDSILKNIKEQIGLLNYLASDLLELAKIESEKIEIHNIPLDIESCIEETVAAYYPIISKKNLELIITYQPHMSRAFYCDPKCLKQVISNFLACAIKFTNMGYIHIHVMLKHYVGKETYLSISITDTGIGLSPRELSEFFIPTIQIPEPIENNQAYSGLGLIISKKIVEYMGGKVEVKSELYQGTTITFEIPAKRILQSQNDLFHNARKLLPEIIWIYEEVEILKVYWLSLFAGIDREVRFIYDLNLEEISQNEGLIILSESEENKFIDNVDSIKQTIDAHNAWHFVFALKSNSNWSKHYKKIGAKACLARPLNSRQYMQTLVNIYIESSLQKIKYVVPSKSININILLAESLSSVQFVVKKLFEQYGFNSIIINNSREAINLSKQQKFDFIFLEEDLPMLGGIETVQYIRETEMNCTTPIILISFDLPKMNILQLNEFKINEFFIKPFEKKHFEILLKKYLAYTSEEIQSLNLWAENEMKTNSLKDNAILHDKELIEVFQSDIKEILFQVHEAIEKNNEDLLSKALHKLKGACRFVGVFCFEPIIVEFEQAIENKKYEVYEAYVADLEFEREALFKDLQELLAAK